MTFDSYPKENGQHYSECGADHAAKVIEYNGVTMNHVLASMSTHQRYEYTRVKRLDGRRSTFGMALTLATRRSEKSCSTTRITGTKSTDPIEMLPTLKCVHSEPLFCNRIEAPEDPDLILGREIDIKFHDRTKYDLKVAEMTTDYIDIFKELRDTAHDRELPKQARQMLSKKIKDILDKDAKSNKAQ